MKRESDKNLSIKAEDQELRDWFDRNQQFPFEEPSDLIAFELEPVLVSNSETSRL